MTQNAFPLFARQPIDNYRQSKRFKAERQFLAIKPEGSTAARIEQFCGRFAREHRLVGTRVGRPRLHITLHGIGNYDVLPVSVVEAMNLIAKAVSQAPFEVVLPTIMTFKGSPSVDGRPSWAPLVLLAEGDALQELHKALAAELRKFGLRAERNFTPHVTVLYGLNVVSKQAIEPIRFMVKEFVFIHSRVGKSEHRTLGRWPLNGGTPTLAPAATGLLL
jgi:2'-5' RNA ligase